MFGWFKSKIRLEKRIKNAEFKVGDKYIVEIKYSGRYIAVEIAEVTEGTVLLSFLDDVGSTQKTFRVPKLDYEYYFHIKEKYEV